MSEQIAAVFLTFILSLVIGILGPCLWFLGRLALGLLVRGAFYGSDDPEEWYRNQRGR